MAESSGDSGLVRIGKTSVGLQGIQALVLAGAVGGGWKMSNDTIDELQEAKEQLGVVESQLERLQDRLSSEESARKVRASESALEAARAEAARSQIEARLATVESCLRAPRSCPLR